MTEKFGVLLVNKPCGMTSHDCVNIVRRALSLKRVGHTGTLDPMAEGLLPVCIGKATKLCDMIGDGDKEYRAEMIFGKTTDTLDVTGEILSETDVFLTEEDIKSAIMSFLGKYDQLPPMYSAKKINGRKLYELARKGETAERKPVEVEIKKLAIGKVSLSENKAEITVECSKGTYIRALIDDIGKKLGCGAVMSKLERTACGSFTLADERVVSAEEIKNGTEESILKKLIPASETVKDLKSVKLDPAAEECFKNGIRLTRLDLSKYRADERVSVFGQGGRLIAIGKIIDEEGKSLGVYKSFYGE